MLPEAFGLSTRRVVPASGVRVGRCFCQTRERATDPPVQSWTPRSVSPNLKLEEVEKPETMTHVGVGECSGWANGAV